VGACDERRGFEGQLGTLLLMRGCPSDGEAAALFRAGTGCAEPDAILAAANGGLHLVLPSSRACVVTAAFDAATLDGSKCDAVHLRVGAGVGAGVEGGGLCGLPTAGGTLRVGAGVEVLRPLYPPSLTLTLALALILTLAPSLAPTPTLRCSGHWTCASHSADRCRCFP
jgi:hypothetical protein